METYLTSLFWCLYNPSRSLPKTLSLPLSSNPNPDSYYLYYKSTYLYTKFPLENPSKIYYSSYMLYLLI